MGMEEFDGKTTGSSKGFYAWIFFLLFVFQLLSLWRNQNGLHFLRSSRSIVSGKGASLYPREFVFLLRIALFNQFSF